MNWVQPRSFRLCSPVRRGPGIINSVGYPNPEIVLYFRSVIIWHTRYSNKVIRVPEYRLVGVISTVSAPAASLTMRWNWTISALLPEGHERSGFCCPRPA